MTGSIVRISLGGDIVLSTFVDCYVCISFTEVAPDSVARRLIVTLITMLHACQKYDVLLGCG